jgi:hypothetical protein
MDYIFVKTMPEQLEKITNIAACIDKCRRGFGDVYDHALVAFLNESVE